ncbi:MAG: hypothetical protein ABII12_09405 [Planctomycetota bacterium]
MNGRRIAILALIAGSSLGGTCQGDGSAGFGGVPRETIPLGGNTFGPVIAGNVFEYTMVLDNATNGVHAEGAVSILTVPYEDSHVSNAVAEVWTVQSQHRTQYGMPIEPVVGTVTSVYKHDAQGFASLIVAEGEDGTMRYVTTPEAGYLCCPEGGKIEVGLAFSSGPVRFDDGSTLASSYVVTAVEVVDVPFGRFEAFRLEANTTTTNASGSEVTDGTEWVHPSVGIVRMDVTHRSGVGVMTTTIELVSTNVEL